MNIIDFEQAREVHNQNKAEATNQSKSNNWHVHYFTGKFEAILTSFQDQNDLVALEHLTSFLGELDKHLDETARMKASAEMLKTVLLQAKANQE